MKGKYITRNIQLACLATEKPKQETDPKKAIEADCDQVSNGCEDENDMAGNTWLVFGRSDAS